MTTADQIDAPVTWHTHAVGDTPGAVWLRQFGVSYTAPVKLHRVWR